MLNLGTVRPGSTIYCPFDSFDGGTGASITLTGLAVGDILIYKDGSMTQRASTAGFTLLDTDGIDIDTITGIHGLSIDLADNTTAGFYAAGSRYYIVISSVTIDAQTVNFVLATFEIGYPEAVLNTTIATLASQTSFTLTDGPAEDDALNGMWLVIHDVASKVQWGTAIVSDYTGSTKTVTLVAGTTFTAAASDNVAVMGPAPLQPVTAGRTIEVDASGIADADVRQWLGTAAATPTVAGVPEVDITHFGGVAGTFASGRPEVNTSHVGGTAQTAGDIIGDTNDIQSRLPAALVGGRMDSSVGAVASGAITADAIAADAIGASELATDAVTEIRSLVNGTADSGTTTTMVDAARTEADTDYWAGALLVFTSGSISGQARYITGFTPATDTITFAPATTQAVGTNTYEIWPTADFLRPTTSGRTLDVSAGGEAGLDWANIGSPSTAQNLSATNIDVDQVVASVSGAVNSVTTGVTVSTNNDKTGYSIGTGGIAAAAFAAGAIDAAAIAADAIGASELAQGAAQEIADEILDRDLAGGASGNTRGVRNALRALRNRVAISGGTVTVYQENDTTSAWTAAVTTAAGDPISEVDPA